MKVWKVGTDLMGFTKKAISFFFIFANGFKNSNFKSVKKMKKVTLKKVICLKLFSNGKRSGKSPTFVLFSCK